MSTEKDLIQLTEAYEQVLKENYGKRVVAQEVVETPAGTLKLQLVFDREWEEWQILTLKKVGEDFNGKPTFKVLKDKMTPVADKEDGIGTMKVMIQRINQDPTSYTEDAPASKPQFKDFEQS